MLLIEGYWSEFNVYFKLLTDIPLNSEDFKSLETKVQDSITRTLTFYDLQLGDITTGDTSLALQILKGKQGVGIQIPK